MPSTEDTSSLQSRLAERLLAAQAKQNLEHWLAVKVEGVGFLIPLAQAGEIYPWSDPHPVPYTRNWFLGVANLRGALCGVINLSKYLEQSQVLAKTGTEPVSQTNDKRLVALHPAFELNAVLAIDQLFGLKNAEALSPVSDSNKLIDSAGESWLPIDMALIAQSESFLNIVAN